MSSPTTSGPRLVHVACIMDGNGRWAKRKHLPRTEGHTEGEENLARLVRIAVTRNVGWRVAELNELNVRIQWMGRPFDSADARTPKYVQRAIRKAIADTESNTGMVLTVAFDYGSHAEIVHAAQAAAAEGMVDQAAIGRHLYLPELPPVDVMVRTSGELRISNFMLWQSMGAEVYFTDRPWPDFDGHELDAALALVH